MEVKIDPTIGDQGPWAEGVRRANRILEMAVGDSFVRVRSSWKLDKGERQQPQLILELADKESKVEGQFAPEELQDSERLWTRIHQLWSEYLQARSQKVMQELFRD